MPSAITHMLLVKYLQDKIEDIELKDCLALGRDFLQTGAVGPDLPYASKADDDLIFKDKSELADYFHNNLTNQIPLRGLSELKKRKGELPDEVKYYVFCFFFGYVSHIVADGIFHPFIRDKVGNYKGHEKGHRELEMDLDVLTYHFFVNRPNESSNLNESNLHKELLNICQDKYRKEAKYVMSAFSSLIKKIYGYKCTPYELLSWVKGLYKLLEIAEGDHHPLYGWAMKSYLYSDIDDLKEQAKSIITLPAKTIIENELNFLKGKEINYFEDVIPHFYQVFTPIANRIYEYVFKDRDKLELNDIADIDLDSGRQLAYFDKLEVTPKYWSVV